MQQQFEDMEEILWEYLDGTCSDANKANITRLIDTERAWREKYAELRMLRNQLATMETHQPSMRFTANLMDNIAGMHVAGTTKQYLNNWIIKSIAAFFLLVIAGIAVYAVTTANWAAGTDQSAPFNLECVMNSGVVNTMVCITIVLSLVFIDRFLRHRGVLHKSL